MLRPATQTLDNPPADRLKVMTNGRINGSEIGKENSPGGGYGRANAGTYFDLVHQFPLKPIRSDDERHRAIGMIDKLLRTELDSGADDYLDVLSTLVETYETATIPDWDLPGSDVLRELMRGHGLTPAELSRKTGIAQSTLSAILTGGRSITVKHAEILGRYFATGAGAFLPL